MSERRIGIVEPLRLASRRLPRKILETVGGERLIDRGLRRLRQLGEATGCPVLVAACAADREIHDAAAAAGVEVFHLSSAAAEAQDWLGIYSGFTSLGERFEWIMATHLTCHPFVRVETVAQAVERCRRAAWPFHTAVAERTLAWSGEHVNSPSVRALLSAPMLDSQKCPLLIRPAHLGSGCSVTDFTTTDRIVDAVPFVPEGLQPIELLDADTPEEMELLRAVADGLASRIRCDGPLRGQPVAAFTAPEHGC